MKLVNCSQKEPVICTQHIDNSVNTTNNTTNNIDNSTTNNNNVIINVFGKENMDYLYTDNHIIERLKRHGKSGIYGFAKILEEVYFNKDRPENNTLIKTQEHGNSVMIKTDDDEWEYREIEDVQYVMIDKIVMYFKAYSKVIKSLNIKLVEQREKNIIKNFAYELLALDGLIPRELFEELEMDEKDVESSEDEIRKKVRKFVRSTMRRIYNRTKQEYRKDKGKYVKIN